MGDIKIYGIGNCDVTRKTMKWFADQNLEFTFHDYKRSGITTGKLMQWIHAAGLQTVMNKRSTTWRELTPDEQAKAKDEKGAISLLLQHTSMIKRPVIEYEGKVIVGYDEQAIRTFFGTGK